MAPATCAVSPPGSCIGAARCGVGVVCSDELNQNGPAHRRRGPPPPGPGPLPCGTRCRMRSAVRFTTRAPSGRIRPSALPIRRPSWVEVAIGPGRW